MSVVGPKLPRLSAEQGSAFKARTDSCWPSFVRPPVPQSWHEQTEIPQRNDLRYTRGVLSCRSEARTALTSIQTSGHEV